MRIARMSALLLAALACASPSRDTPAAPAQLLVLERYDDMGLVAEAVLDLSAPVARAPRVGHADRGLGTLTPAGFEPATGSGSPPASPGRRALQLPGDVATRDHVVARTLPIADARGVSPALAELSRVEGAGGAPRWSRTLSHAGRRVSASVSLCSVDDLDGDGLVDIAWSAEGVPFVELVSSRDGRVLRVLHDAPGGGTHQRWLARGPDLDGDGVAELLVVDANDALRSAPSLLRVIAPRSGAVLFELGSGVEAHVPSFHTTFTGVACTPDTDGDGLADILLEETRCRNVESCETTWLLLLSTRALRAHPMFRAADP